MGFIRRQEERVTIKFLIWKYQKMNIEVPPDSELQKQASKIVDDAHRIARKRGSNVLAIIKESIGDFMKPK
jgi:hypothetical protein